MAYRSGTYVAFHANGTDVPINSDIKYYNLIKAWSGKSDDEFSFVNSHEKASAVRNSSSKATLKASLQARLRNSKNMILIIGETTRFDTDWVPFEIEQAIRQYEIPIIAAYTITQQRIIFPQYLSGYWPKILASEIAAKNARVIHIPFKKLPLSDAVNRFNHENMPAHGLWFYSVKSYNAWGIFE